MFLITILTVLRRVRVALVVFPGRDANKVRHEGRDRALEDRRVAPDHILVVHLGLIKLLHHCGTQESHWVTRGHTGSHWVTRGHTAGSPGLRRARSLYSNGRRGAPGWRQTHLDVTLRSSTVKPGSGFGDTSPRERVYRGSKTETNLALLFSKRAAPSLVDLFSNPRLAGSRTLLPSVSQSVLTHPVSLHRRHRRAFVPVPGPAVTALEEHKVEVTSLKLRMRRKHDGRCRALSCYSVFLDRITVVRTGREIVPLLGVPRHDRDEVGHERRHLALKHGRVAADGVLLVHVGVVVLRHDCGKQQAHSASRATSM